MIASIQKITNVRPHPNADSLNLGTVLGWQVVFNKLQNDYKDGDLVVYIEIDSVVPDIPQFDFLKNKNFRVKPIRLRGEASNGLCMPLNAFPDHFKDDVQVGQDVSELLNIQHYEKPLPASLSGDVVGYIPPFIIKTDETNLRSYPDALNELKNKEYYITRKDDGSSVTFFVKDGEFGVCSRQLQLKKSDKNTIWLMNDLYHIEENIKQYFPNINVAIQGELVGPGVNGNNLGLKSHEVHLFSILFLDNRKYSNYHELVGFCNTCKIPMVTFVEHGNNFEYTLDDLITLSNKQKYANDQPGEGIVIRPVTPFFSPILNKIWSGKVINEMYKD